MKRKLQALLVILLMGVLKLPVEQAATRHLREAGLLSLPLDVSVRDSIGQMGFAASLGGLRSLVASITYMQAYTAWTNVDWAKVDAYFSLTTSLQPRYVKYWDEAAWQMAYNAASNYRNNGQLNAAVREKLYKDHIQRGVDILKQALHLLPNSAVLWKNLAEIYERRVKSPREAAEAYMEVYRINQSIHFSRLAAYQYAATEDPVLWQKAYDLLKASYEKNQRPPTLINTLKDLEERLKIPAAERIPDAAKP